jgi:hypothetical protein
MTPYIFPFWLKRHLDSLLFAFHRTGERQLEHPSFSVFTQWCSEHAEELGLNEPSSNQVDVVSLRSLPLDDHELRAEKELDPRTPITDKMRLSFITEQVASALGGEQEPLRYIPTDVMLLGGRSAGVVSLGFLYLFAADGTGAPGWEGFFESPAAFRVWLRSQGYYGTLEEVLALSERERLSHWAA